MSIAVLIVGIVLGIVVFGLGLPKIGSTEIPKRSAVFLGLGTLIIMVSILAVAWVPAIERWLAG